MKTEYLTHYSPALGRDMECMVYGHAGRPVLYIPCQDGRFFDFGDFHMAETLAPWIESGQIIVFSVDTIDKETWSDKGGEPYWRARRHEQWMDYLTREMAPRMLDRTGQDGILSFGCSLGATHAANLYLRRPDLFNGMLALSGIYNADYGFGGYMDEVVYQNSPVHYMANLPETGRRHRTAPSKWLPKPLPESYYPSYYYIKLPLWFPSLFRPVPQEPFQRLFHAEQFSACSAVMKFFGHRSGSL